MYKRIGVVVILMVLVCVLTACVGGPEATYKKAQELFAEGKYREAYEAFWSLNGYWDSAEQATIAYQQYTKIQEMKQASVGSYITFGSYEQDADDSNGKEPIEWLVLAKENERLLVISKYGLDFRKYNEERSDVTWETCTLRTWLNNDFFNAAFTSTERTLIHTVTVTADKNPDYNTDPGKDTQDKVFLLSILEANKYFTFDSVCVCKPTAYASEQGSIYGSCAWWLRSPGHKLSAAALVNGRGNCDDSWLVDMDFIAVRPALWVNLEP